jgi:hypothetical protein
VQFIRGTLTKDPPDAKAKPIGLKLEKKLAPVLKWKYYWEIYRQDLIFDQPLGIKHISLPLGRSVEVEIAGPNRIDVRLFKDKQLVRSSRHRSHDKMTAILGGEDGNDAWFVVVRRETPQYQLAKD